MKPFGIIISDTERCVDEIIAYVGDDIRVGTALGAGKPNYLLNALYQRVKKNPQYRLTIYSALTPEKPKAHSELESRLIQPMVERIYGDYPDLDFEIDRVQQRLPSNIQVIEFFHPAGKFNQNDYVQMNYMSSNYTHAVRDFLSRGVNVVMQLVAKESEKSNVEVHGSHLSGASQTIAESQARFSLSCNADMFGDFIDQFKLQKQEGKKVLIIGQVNQNLPFMFGDAIRSQSEFDYIVDQPAQYFQIYSPPKAAVGDPEYMIGFYDSLMVRDGGELQIGIGAIGDSATTMMLLRHQQNDEYRKLIKDLKADLRFSHEIGLIGGWDPFEEGLFGATEMMVDGFIHLLKAGILKRKVYDHLGLQRLFNEKKISEEINESFFEHLLEAHLIKTPLHLKDFEFLKHWGIFKPEVRFHKWHHDTLLMPDGTSTDTKVTSENIQFWKSKNILGKILSHGRVIHAGFFMGPAYLYKSLREMPIEQRELIDMRSVLKINQLYGHETIDRLHRKNARFLNTCLTMTLTGAAASDGIDNGKVVSGIGGQYNFVSQAHALPDGRSVINLRSTRGSGESLRSNIVWTYPHTSIPRHLRDVVVTEYGIAHLRGRTDQEVVAALLNITDSRFQEELLNKAKTHGKISRNYQIPEIHRNNLPSSYQGVLSHWKKQGYFPRFPFGTDLTQEEVVLTAALKKVKTVLNSKSMLLKVLLKSYFTNPTEEQKKYLQPLLERMNLEAPKNSEESLHQKILTHVLLSSNKSG